MISLHSNLIQVRNYLRYKKERDMQYDPIKNKIASLIEIFPFLRKTFFTALDFILLRQWYVKKYIKKYYPPGAGIRFYDGGAGFCQYSDFILSGWKESTVFALDLKTDYVESYAHYATQYYGKRFRWTGGDLVTYQPVKKYNLIAAIDILEHIEDDRQVLANFFECLEPGGKLIISTPSDKDEAARFTAEHVRPGYDPDDLREKLLSAGFTIRDFIYSYGRWGKLSWILAMKVPLKMLSVSKGMAIALAIYYTALYPLIYLLMKLDMKANNRIGNGIIVVAERE